MVEGSDGRYCIEVSQRWEVLVINMVCTDLMCLTVGVDTEMNLSTTEPLWGITK